MNPEDTQQPQPNQEPLVTGPEPTPQAPATPPESGPAQPPVDQPTQPAAAPTQPQAVAPAAQTDTLGIVSIVLAFLGMQLIGLIIGIVGNNKAKKEGYSNKLSKIGIILNVIFLILGTLLIIGLFALGFWGAQQAADEVDAVNSINIVSSELENYYLENQYYPQSLDTLSGGETLNDALQTVKDDSDITYTPIDCISDECSSYDFYYESIDGETYTKSSLY